VKKTHHLIFAAASALALISVWKLNAPIELLGATLGVWLSETNPVKRLFENLKESAMRASLK
jgi:hypothetical protein